MEGQDIANNVRAVLERLHRAARRAGRAPEAVRLVAATKSVPVELIRQAIEAGVRLLGENRLQEAIPKLRAVDHPGVRWHWIGRLQRRKVRQVIGEFEMIHSVDSVELATEIDRRAQAAGVEQSALIEVNIGEEPSKAGFAPSALREALRHMDGLTSLRVCGLMAVPPFQVDPEATRPYFRSMRELALTCRADLRHITLGDLSMGMSHDFEIAVEEGATFVRVGTALFGQRPQKLT